MLDGDGGDCGGGSCLMPQLDAQHGLVPGPMKASQQLHHSPAGSFPKRDLELGGLDYWDITLEITTF